MSETLTLDTYQELAVRSDRTRGRGLGIDLPVLGLVGEVGGLLSEIKKRQRDPGSYLGYEANVLEEMGDALWYLAAVAEHGGLSLSSIAASAEGPARTFAELQPQRALPLAAPTVAFERTLLRLAGAVGRLAEKSVSGAPSADLAGDLSAIFRLVVAAADETGVVLEEAASGNLRKAEDRWPSARVAPAPFDDAFPEEERLPRTLEIDIFERVAGNGKAYVVQRCNGLYVVRFAASSRWFCPAGHLQEPPH